MGLSYHRMDGGTSISVRLRLIDDFNTNPRIDLFLLTTKVGLALGRPPMLLNLSPPRSAWYILLLASAPMP